VEGKIRMSALKFLREQKHMSQKELADALGVQPTSISRYERGVRKLSVEKAKRIAEILGVDWTCLYNEADIEGDTSK
jgi:transcriptional regulator with XRE-family HTH domain